MSIPETYKSFRRTAGALPLTIEPATETLPTTLAADSVLVKVRAVSLNFRDVAMLHGRYISPFAERGIPASDMAGEVVAVGAGVLSSPFPFQPGDRVAANFFTNFFTGKETDDLGSLGGNEQGVLSEYVVFPAEMLVRLPEHLSFEEGSTLACAGVTAWTSLNNMKGLSEKSTVLLEGASSANYHH